jgi:hypothetical protein
MTETSGHVPWLNLRTGKPAAVVIPRPRQARHPENKYGIVSLRKQARITSTGSVGIGTTSPGALLAVVPPTQTVATTSAANYLTDEFLAPNITRTGTTHVTGTTVITVSISSAPSCSPGSCVASISHI